MRKKMRHGAIAFVGFVTTPSKNCDGRRIPPHEFAVGNNCEWTSSLFSVEMERAMGIEPNPEAWEALIQSFGSS
jgi:hypothetical protein